MKEIEKVEKITDPQVHSSFHPEEYRPCYLNKVPDHLTRCRYLPCHYFDYIGGTSTGGYV